jgi:CheY-like chemotaxis protein
MAMKKILIAEDDFPSRELLAEVLFEWGYEVVQASDGIEALEKIEKTIPDLVLLDIQMPLLDGFAVVAKIRSTPRLATVPVVAISAYAMRDDSRRICRAGFDAHVAKPLDLGALRALLERHFSGIVPGFVPDTITDTGTGPAR